MIEFLLLLAGFGLGTAFAGWWGVAVVAALWSLFRRGAPWRAGAAAALSWITLVAFSVSWGPLSRLVPRVGGAVGLPGWSFLLLPPLFAWLLGWSSARVCAGFSAPRDR